MHRWFLAPLLGVSAALAGCGTPAAPEPPSLNLPLAVLNLSAERVGNSVRLAWTMPTRTTDKLLLRRPVAVEICRAMNDGPCNAIAGLNLEPGQPGSYGDALPPELNQGADRLLRYEVTLRNHAGKSAGPSNAAYSLAGISPPALTGLTAQVRREGVALGWDAVPQPGRSVVFRIERLRIGAAEPPPATKSALAPSPPPPNQTLIVRSPEGTDPGHALDSSAAFNGQYRYVVERVETANLSGQSVEMQGAPSQAIPVSTTDTFAPGVPQGLAAVADAASGAIDLSWIPNSDNDLAAYRVYRRDVKDSSPAHRIADLHLETSFRDTTTQTEHTYAYALSAVDQSGNESQRSAEVEETLPRT